MEYSSKRGKIELLEMAEDVYVALLRHVVHFRINPAGGELLSSSL